MTFKRTLNKKLSLIGVMSLLWGAPVLAEKMDLEANDLVIGKLESTLKSLKQEDKTINTVTLKIQLANLYSEKARLLLVEEGKQGCDNCLKSVNTRQKAIELYSSVTPQQLDLDGGQSSLQLAYLLEATNSNKTLPIYNRLIQKKTTTKANLIKSYSKRAEFYFKEGAFDKSIADFQKVQSLSPQAEHGAVLHKIAWAYFNKGEIDQATNILFQILSHSNAKTNNPIDESFQIEVARDLALFITKVSVTQNLLSKVFEVTPASERATNLLFFSEESERIGEIQNAVTAWEILIKSKDITKEQKTSALLGLARNHRENHRFEKSNSYFAQALETTKASDEDSAKVFKLFLTQWEKQIKKFTKTTQIKDSQIALLVAYDHFLKYFTDNYEVYLWQAQLAQKVNKFDKALASYSRASDLIAESIKNTKSSTAQANQRKLLNEVLLTEVSLAENSVNSKLKLTAYEHYLTLYPTGPENAKVRYQKAKLFYDLNDYSKSYELFNEIATDSKYTNMDLKLKSANLALDSLAIKKDIPTLEEKSNEYAKRFPQNHSEFNTIAVKAGMQITKSIAARDESAKNAESALDKLNSININPKTSKPSDYKQYLMTKIELETKAHQWTQALNHLNDFLSLKSVNATEKSWALNKKLSISEFILDFKMAYQTLLQLKYNTSKDPKELLKGALIAELAQYPVLPWLEKVIKSPQSSKDQSDLARVQMIRLSSNPWKSLHQMSSFLKNKPNLLANIALECFSNDNRYSEIPWVLSFSGVKQTWEGKTLQRMATMKNLKDIERSLANQSINAKNDMTLTKSLQKRVTTLQNLQSTLHKAQRNEEWSIEVVVATRLKIENQRLAGEIETLPVPKNIKKDKAKAQFKLELVRQAQPFHKTASELNTYLIRLWKDKTYLTSLLETIDANDRVRPTLMKELSSVASIAPRELVNEVQAQLNEFKNRPSNKDIATTQLELQKDPFDADLHNLLLSMEKKRGNRSMVVFLQARGQNLKGGRL